jgi:hypothetical protein
MRCRGEGIGPEEADALLDRCPTIKTKVKQNQGKMS